MGVQTEENEKVIGVLTAEHIQVMQDNTLLAQENIRLAQENARLRMQAMQNRDTPHYAKAELDYSHSPQMTGMPIRAPPGLEQMSLGPSVAMPKFCDASASATLGGSAKTQTALGQIGGSLRSFGHLSNDKKDFEPMTINLGEYACALRDFEDDSSFATSAPPSVLSGPPSVISFGDGSPLLFASGVEPPVMESFEEMLPAPVDVPNAFSKPFPSAPEVTASQDDISVQFPSVAFQTVMMRNLPNNYSRAMLLQLLDEEGFYGAYDFVYLPIDFHSSANFGYAFINFVSTLEALRFKEHFQNFSDWAFPSEKVCDATWSNVHQGLAAHIDRYRSSPVMHIDRPDECKPAIFWNGIRVPFPPPLKKIRAPRIRHR